MIEMPVEFRFQYKLDEVVWLCDVSLTSSLMSENKETRQIILTLIYFFHLSFRRITTLLRYRPDKI